MDLGANEWVTFREVTLPLIMPGILAAACSCASRSRSTISSITYFNAGSTVTFPLFVWGAARIGDASADQRDRHRDLHHRRRRDAREHRLPEPVVSERSSRRMTLDLQQAARDHLWLHFTRMGAYGEAEVPIIVRGDGCYLEDSNGKRYLDALAGLFAVQIGYSHGDEIGQAAHEQMKELPFYTNWSYAHPRAIELRARGRAARAGRPEPRLLRLGRLGGGRVRLEARAPVPPRRAASAAGRRSPAAPRTTARRWARSRSTASRRSRTPSSRSCPTRCTCATRTATTAPPTRPRSEFTSFLLDDLEETILATGPSTVAMVIMEPVQNAGGCVHAARRATSRACARSATAYGILLCADEVITGFGRVGAWFASGAVRHPARPDHVARRASPRRTRRSAP